jgi:beta-lactamase class A
MDGLAGRIFSGMRRRRRTLAAAGLALLAAAGAGGWINAGSRHAANASFISDRPDMLPVLLPAPPAPIELQAQLDALAAAYREPVGIAVVDVAEGWTAHVDGHSPYPQQSVSKLWVAISVLDAIDKGGLSLDHQVIMRPEDRSVFYQPVSQRIGPDGFPITLRELLQRAISESDNAANDKLMSEVGGAGPVTDTLAEKGLEGIAVGAYERDLQSKIAGLTWIPQYGYGWNFKAARAELPQAVRDAAEAEYLAAPPDGATPAAIAQGLAALKRGELLSPASTETLLTMMEQARTGPRRLKGGLPQGWTIAHKTGTGPDWRHGSVGINDVGLLTAPDGRVYAVAVMMRRTRAPVPSRLAMMQSVSRAVAEHWRASGQFQAAGQELAAAEATADGGL